MMLSSYSAPNQLGGMKTLLSRTLQFREDTEPGKQSISTQGVSTGDGGAESPEGSIRQSHWTISDVPEDLLKEKAQNLEMASLWKSAHIKN